MATGTPSPVNVMNDALTRTNAWVNRAGVVLDPTPVFGSNSRQGSMKNEQGVAVRDMMPPELSALLQNGNFPNSLDW